MDKSENPSQPQASDQTEVLAKLLYSKVERDKRNKIRASIKNVLTVLGIGATITAAALAPKAASSLLKIFYKKENNWDSWKQFNQGYLRQTLRRLERQKLVEVRKINGKEQITITDTGKTKLLTYSLAELEVPKQKNWDKKWRIVIYDIPNKKKRLQKLMRETLKNLGFLQIQESVYINPYPCYKEIEFLRTYYRMDEYIKYLLVEKLEDDSAYKTYFGIK